MAPVMTIFPVLNISAVVRVGSFILIITAANLLGLYSAFLHLNAMSFKSRSHLKFAVETKFYNLGAIYSAGYCFLLAAVVETILP